MRRGVASSQGRWPCADLRPAFATPIIRRAMGCQGSGSQGSNEKRLAITASLYFQKALPYEKNYYLQIVGAKLLPKICMAPIFCIKKG
ncbi:MAG: hypothetical protein IKW97_04925 [Muribaculaceae bacterium]|nr:hypothetical protein [Muribaculaceae bacterium]